MPTVYTPAVSTYVPLATITLASTDSEIVFSSIPATYRDLVLVFNGKAGAGGAYPVYFNGDNTASNYNRVYAYGDGSSAVSGAENTHVIFELATTEGTNILHFMDYSSTDKHKTTLVRGGYAGAITIMMTGRWANTAAINQISLQTPGTNFIAGSTFSLYGIAA